jgi:hypothetical protein
MSSKFQNYLNLCHLSPVEFCVLFECETHYSITGNIKWTVNGIIGGWKLCPPSIFNVKQFFPFRYDYTRKELKDAINQLIQKNCMYFYDKAHIEAITTLFKKTPVLAKEPDIPEEGDVGISPLGRIIIQHSLYLLRLEENNSSISDNNDSCDDKGFPSGDDFQTGWTCEPAQNGDGWIYFSSSLQDMQFGLNINKDAKFAHNIKECGPWTVCWMEIFPSGYTCVCSTNVCDCSDDVPSPQNLDSNSKPNKE